MSKSCVLHDNFSTTFPLHVHYLVADTTLLSKSIMVPFFHMLLCDETEESNKVITGDQLPQWRAIQCFVDNKSNFSDITEDVSYTL